MEVMEEEAQELLSYFNHRNVDALLRLTRNTLEMLRKRIHASSLMHFLGGSNFLGRQNNDQIMLRLSLLKECFPHVIRYNKSI